MKDITTFLTENEGLIYKIINKYKPFFELDDLYQVGCMGLIKAFKNYKANYKTKFSTYAYPYILGEVIKYINEFKSIKQSKSTRQLYLKILRTKELLSQKLMKEPSLSEVALYLEMDESLVEEIISSNITIDSLDKIISLDGKNLELYDKIGYIEESIDNYPLLSELSRLSPTERAIITKRYYEDMSQKEVGKSLGMYQVEISRREKKILKKLRDNIAA